MTQYDLVVADPPWSYDNKQNGAADNHYGGMTQRELLKMREDGALCAILAKDAVLGLWTTTPFKDEALELMHGWGFDYKTSLYWHKTGDRCKACGHTHEQGDDCLHETVERHGESGQIISSTFCSCADFVDDPGRIGTGYWFRGEMEELLVGKRGGAKAFRLAVRNVHREKATAHSAKPEWFQDMMELGGDKVGLTSRLELFARRRRPGWRCEGIELTGHDHRYRLGEEA